MPQVHLYEVLRRPLKIEEIDENMQAVQLAIDNLAAAIASAVATAADRIQTGLDKVTTAADRVQTGLDKVATAADRTQTGLDKVATAADRTQTGLDKVATAADRTQTGLDRVAAAASAAAVDTAQISAAVNATAADREQTGLDKVATAADLVATSANRVQTGLDKVATAADRTQTGLDKVAAAASAAAAGAVAVSVDRLETSAALAANDINIAAGSVFTKTITGPTTLTVSNVPAAGVVGSFILELTNAGTNITWWANIKWSGGVVPGLTISGKDAVAFYTHDAGANWTGLVIGRDIK